MQKKILYVLLAKKSLRGKNRSAARSISRTWPIKLKADKGDVDEQWRLAWAYADGELGLDKDDQMALKYFQKVVEKKDIASQYVDTALMSSAYKGHASVVTLLLADDRVDPNMADQNGATALTLSLIHI